jgi:hypothetical protein
MATVYTTAASLAVTGIAAISSGTLSKAVTAAAEDVYTATQSIGTSSEILLIPAEIAAGSAGVILIKNTDTSNYVEFAFTNPAVPGASTIRIDAGCFAMLPKPSAALYGIANTSAVVVQVWAVEA